jgi:HEPN domain-containing protein
MPNKTYAKEWMTFAKKNLDTAELLFKANHYEDIIGIEIQQSLEKMLKALMANENIKIPKEHDLVKLYYIVEDFLKLKENEIILLKVATNYYKEDRYPNPNYFLPSREEINEILSYTQKFFERVCKILEIDKNDLTM